MVSMERWSTVIMKHLFPAETRRLVLRHFQPQDLEDLHAYLSDPQVVAFEPYEPMTLDETRENLNWRISTDEMIAVVLKSTGKLIGNIYLGKRNYEALELGFVFNAQYWGQGYAQESCEKLIELAFQHGIHRIWAECDPENLRSWKLLEKLGFVREGYLKRNVYFWKDENGIPIWKDTFLYGRLRDF